MNDPISASDLSVGIETMKIGMTTFGCDGGRSGIGQYVLNLLREFNTSGRIRDIDIYHYSSERAVFGAPDSDGLGISDRYRFTPLGLAWYQTVLPRKARQNRYNAFFFPEANRRLPSRMPCPTVGTVHDFSSVHMTGKYDPVREFYIKRVLPALVRRLTHIITVSESTKTDIVEFAGIPADRITVIPHGVDCSLYSPGDRETAAANIRAQFNFTRPYILYISRIEHPGKNHVCLIRAFERLKADHRIPHSLVLAGSDWSRADEVHRTARESSAAESIVFTGFVSQSQLPDLYRGADVFVFPSLYEGFGMPLLEAMACGTPVACSNCSSLPEVGGDAVDYFDPNDYEAMAHTLLLLLTDTERWQQRSRDGLARARRYSWEQAAALTWETIQKTALSVG